MKYISMFVMVALMAISWQVMKANTSMSEDVHISIQEEVKRLISEYIQKNLPKASEVKFERMWTEPTSKDHQLKASFIYSFSDRTTDTGPTKVKIEGFAILNRDKNSTPEDDIWSFDELQILNNHIEFDEGILIRAEKDK